MLICLARSFAIVVCLTMMACSTAPTSPSGPSAIQLPEGFSILSDLAVSAAASPAKVEGQGTVAAVAGTCPDLTMVVHGIRVTTNSSTTFDDSLACGNLRPGTKVVVQGTVEDRAVTATSIRIVDQPGGKPPDPVAGDGTVGSRKGTCPTLTMVVHGYPVMTTAATTFEDGTCDDVQPGTRIHVEGTIVANSVLASLVRILPQTP